MGRGGRRQEQQEEGTGVQLYRPRGGKSALWGTEATGTTRTKVKSEALRGPPCVIKAVWAKEILLAKGALGRSLGKWGLQLGGYGNTLYEMWGSEMGQWEHGRKREIWEIIRIHRTQGLVALLRERRS